MTITCVQLSELLPGWVGLSLGGWRSEVVEEEEEDALLLLATKNDEA